MTFTSNGEHIVGGGEGDEVGVWRVEDGKQMATLRERFVTCLAVSKDGRWIAAGSRNANVSGWDAKTFEQVFWHKEDDNDISGVDFSPDSTRLVAGHRTATVLDFATRKKVQTLDHEHWVLAAKYSPQGDRIATATYKGSVRVWDSNDGRLLVDIPLVNATPYCNKGLLWSNNHLFVASDSAIKKLDASTGSTLSEWPVHDTMWSSCIALPKHAEFIAYSTNDTVTCWNTSTHTQLGLIQLPQCIWSIAFSPDDQFLATGGDGRKITIRSLSSVIVGASQQLSCSAHLSKQDPIHSTFQEPDIQIDDAALESWKHDQLENANSLLTTAIAESRNPTHHVLASRALVRARLRLWDAALVDADQVLVALSSHTLTLTSVYTKTIKVHPSIMGYIAKSVALVGNGERDKGYQACDTAFDRFHSSHTTFLLVVKVCIFEPGSQLLISLRLSSCSWPESTAMRYLA